MQSDKGGYMITKDGRLFLWDLGTRVQLIYTFIRQSSSNKLNYIARYTMYSVAPPLSHQWLYKLAGVRHVGQMTRTNELGQPIGDAIDWTPRPWPEHKTIKGTYCTLVKPLPEHTEDLYEAHKGTDADWTYMFDGPFESLEQFESMMQKKQTSNDPLHFVVLDNSTGKAVGCLSFLRIDPNFGVVEVGHVAFSNKMKGTFMSTEAQYLMMREAFEVLGYRRYEWKCDSLNAPSRNAAARLGFSYEGLFRQAVVYRGRSRDTAWFSVIDSEWPPLKKRFQGYLDPANSNNGKQIKPLQEF